MFHLLCQTRAAHARVPIAASAALALALHACSVFDEGRLGPPPSAYAAVPPPAADAGSGGRAEVPAAGARGTAAAGSDAAGQPSLDAAVPDDGAPPPDAGRPLPECNPPSVESYCAHIPALSDEPVIDGDLDCGAQLLELPPVGWNGVQPMPADHRTLMAAATRPNGLYVYVEVHGGEPPRPHPPGSYIDCGDAVEIYVDADGAIDEKGKYSTPGTMQFIVAAPASDMPVALEALRFVAGESQGPWSSEQVRTVLRPDGYAVEAFITAMDLDLTAWSPSARIGFNVTIDVAAPAESPDLACGLQLGQYFMRMGTDDDVDGGICHGKPWCDSRAFCTPEI
jgi:hypothetical protein